MLYFPDDQSEDNLKKIRRNNVCAECGRQLAIYLAHDGRSYIACSGQVHEGIAREYTPPREDYESKIRRETELVNEHGQETSSALAHIPKQGQLTKSEAMEVLKLVYPNVPEPEIVRTALLCRDFGLHPLMKEVYIIPFKEKGGKDNWVTVLGINATRKMMARMGSFSYVDNTPRVMTEQEQKEIFGEVHTDRIQAITKLRTKGGLEAQGYGSYQDKDTPYGTEKGNTKANMAFIRSERQAFSRLFPDAIPQQIDIVDEAYVEGIGNVDKKTGEIKAKEEAIEGEFKEVTPEPESELPKPKGIKPVGDVSDPEAGIQGEQLHHLSKITSDAGSNLKQLTKWCEEEKGWVVPTFNDLKVWQYLEIVESYNKGS